MHDRNGTPLKVGDEVIIHAKVLETMATEDYCNVTLESTHGRRPDGLKECICGINTGVLVKLENAG
jgi:hypothetical protein